MNDNPRTASAISGWRPTFGFEHVITRRSELDAMNSAGEVAVRFEPGGSAGFHLGVSGSQTQTLSIWKTRSCTGFLSVPQMIDELVTVRFVDTGVMSRTDAAHGQMIAHGGQIIIAAFDELQTERAEPNFTALTATVRRSALLDAASALTGRKYQASRIVGTVHDAGRTRVRLLRTSLDRLHRELFFLNDALGLSVPLLEEIFLFQLLGVFPETCDEADVTQASNQAVARAVSFIEECLHTNILISDIAAAAMIPVRTLQGAFKRQMGMGLLQYITARRLDEVRAALKKADGLTIQAVATQFGFNHMGEFAGRYRARFGVLPSADR